MRAQVGPLALPGFAELAGTTRLGAYEIVRLLGRGGMGSVYECRHVALGRTAAVKVLHPHLAPDRVAAARFLREGQLAARIRHPNVVEVFDVGEQNGVPYLVMEFVEGDDLATHMRQRSPLSIHGIADCVLGIVAGVAAAHEAGVIHRDLKPSNVRLARDHLLELRPKVLDFGISKVLSEIASSDLTDSNGILGTTRYMAPEQLRSAKHADVRSDVYAIGVILYEGLTGSLPFYGGSVYEHLHAVLTGPIRPPSALRTEVPAALEALVLRALQRNPEARFSSAQELGQALADFATAPGLWRREFASRSDGGTCIRSSVGDMGGAAFTLASSDGRKRRGRARVVALMAGALVVGAVAMASWQARQLARSEPVPIDLRGRTATTSAPIEPGASPPTTAATDRMPLAADPGVAAPEGAKEGMPATGGSSRASSPPARHSPAQDHEAQSAPELYEHM
jgi:serine/threonine protein kinase